MSPQYAREICTREHGCGLEGVLKSRRQQLTGIINGIDQEVWDPRTDPHLAENYDTRSWRDGKASNKKFLQAKFGLELSAETAMIGLVGRLAHQKGLGSRAVSASDSFD